MDTSLEKTINDLRMSRDLYKASKMEAYMKHKFEYLGIQAPLRNELSKDFLKELKLEKAINWNIVWTLWELNEREFQYLALKYLEMMNKYLQENDIHKIAKLITCKSWWDTVDGTVNLVGPLVKTYPELQEKVIKVWTLQEDIWLKRISIIFQLKYKQDTNLEFLSFAILKNCHSKEFFLNKAIGWALREYSKTDADWVKKFILTYKLNSLSVREGLKYI
jgi:3-methyladenine DNA glycosylase AlkD